MPQTDFHRTDWYRMAPRSRSPALYAKQELLGIVRSFVNLTEERSHLTKGWKSGDSAYRGPSFRHSLDEGEARQGPRRLSSLPRWEMRKEELPIM